MGETNSLKGKGETLSHRGKKAMTLRECEDTWSDQ